MFYLSTGLNEDWAFLPKRCLTMIDMKNNGSDSQFAQSIHSSYIVKFQHNSMIDYKNNILKITHPSRSQGRGSGTCDARSEGVS